MNKLIMELATANRQMSMRTGRLAELYYINAPEPIIEKEYALIRQSGESIRDITMKLRALNQN